MGVLQLKLWVWVTSVALLLLCSPQYPAFAQENILEEIAGETQADVTDENSTPDNQKNADILIAPVPFSSPSTGPGLAGGVVAFYNPNGGPQQWVSGIGVIWTNRGSKGVAAYHNMSLNSDNIRISALASYLDANQRYFGIGYDAGSRGEAIELRNKTFETVVNAQIRVVADGLIGIRFRVMTNDARATNEVEFTPSPPKEQLSSTLVMLGPTFTFDTRDSASQPRQGLLGSASWLFGMKALGHSFRHQKLTLSGSAYLPLSPKTVLATNARLCSATGQVPFYDLCLFGSNASLRGYPTGQYRDGASWAIQAELRQQLIGRWGGTVFLGVGGVARSVGQLIGSDNFLPAAGIGVRYRPFADNDIQLRLDFAIGRGSRGLYLGIGEAF